MSDTAPILGLAAGFPPATDAAWRALVDKVLKGADFDRRLASRSADDIRISPLYTRANRIALQVPPREARRLGGWDIRQRHGEPDASATNAAILADLEGGVTSIALQIEAPGQTGVGYTAGEMRRALDGVLLDVCPVALDAGEYTVDSAGSLMAIWRERGIVPESCIGAFGYDPLGTLARTGALYNSLAKALATAAHLVKDVAGMPGVTALLADGRPYHAAGASEGQELAAVLATLVAYLRAAEQAGTGPADCFPKIAVALAADQDQLLTMAKLRAARSLIARIGAACGLSDAGRIHVTAETAGRMMARRDPWVNMLRTTVACAAAALGGADAITVAPFTAALGLPDVFARRIARNTQHVLMAESGLGQVADPAAGSFAIETLTADLAKAAWGLFQDIEARGGIGRALEAGMLQADIARVAGERARQLATGRIDMTGVSAFPMLGPDGVTVRSHPPVPSADLNGAKVKPLAISRLAAPFEALRDAADACAARAGAPPRVFLASLGDLATHGSRSTWIANYLAAGGIEAIRSDGFASSQDAARAFAESGASIACICSSDQVYAELAEATASALRHAGARRVLLAGRPGPLETSLKAVGVDTFVFAGSDAVATLRELHRALGV
jgi:methylmalonyl-CoA mutase